MAEKTMDQMAHADWLARGRELYGDDPLHWRFRCVRCGGEQCGQDFLHADAGMTKAEAMSHVFYCCIGRVDYSQGCDWSLGGLLHIHEREVIIDPDEPPEPVFLFANEPEEPDSTQLDLGGEPADA